MDSSPGLNHRALDLAGAPLPVQGRREGPDYGPRPPEAPRPSSLGRPPRINPPPCIRPPQPIRIPAQVVTTASRNHIIYTDQKGRKIPYNDTPKLNPVNPVMKATSLLHHNSHKNYGIKVGIYGWRKRCLYLLIMALMVMMIVNLALTLWVLKVMDFNLDGMGPLKITPGGLQVMGQAMALDSLYTSSIRSKRGLPIIIEASRNFSINTRDENGNLTNKIFLGNDKMECLSPSLRISDQKGGLLFSADAQEVVVGAETLRVAGTGGAAFQGSVQTPHVRASSGNALLLESQTRSLEMRAAQSITIDSRAGDITATCLTNLKLQSIAGAIKLDASSVFMPKLKSALPLPSGTPRSRDPHHHDIYQLCACANGKLFLASPHGICAAKEDSYICR